MSEPLEPKLYDWRQRTEGLLIPELEPGPPPNRWQRIVRRLRATPSRLWWALFGEVY